MISILTTLQIFAYISGLRNQVLDDLGGQAGRERSIWKRAHRARFRRH